MKWFICVFLTLVCLAPCVTLAGGGKEGGSVTRTSYLAERGTIVSPEEVLIDSYIASIDFGYPKPTSSLVGVSLYSGHRQLSIDGQEEIIQIALKSGYYDTPKKTTINKLAKSFGISPSTLAEILQRAEKKIIDKYFMENK